MLRVSVMVVVALAATLMIAMAADMTPTTTVGLPDLKILLTGDPANPTIVNNSDRQIIVYVLHFFTQENGVYKGRNIEVRNALIQIRQGETQHAGIAPHTSQQTNPHPIESQGGQGGPVARVTLDSVVFDNGEFAGPDTTQFYDYIAGAGNAQRDLFQSIVDDRKNGKKPAETWARIAAMATNDQPATDDVSHWIAGQIRADATLLTMQYQQHGDVTAFGYASDAARRMPKIWRHK